MCNQRHFLFSACDTFKYTPTKKIKNIVLLIQDALCSAAPTRAKMKRRSDEDLDSVSWPAVTLAIDLTFESSTVPPKGEWQLLRLWECN